ncbi:hypothetical protein Tco_0246865 [Tanacetum coccineum]
MLMRLPSFKLRVKELEKFRSQDLTSSKDYTRLGRYGDNLMFDTCVLDDEEVFAGQDIAGQDMDEKEINVAEKEVSIADQVTTAGEVVTTANVEISTASPPETTITDDLTLAQTLIEIRSKAIMEEPEKPTKRKDQIRHDEEVAQRLQAQLQAELEEEDRLVRHREEEANIVSWDNHNQLKNKSFDDIHKLFDKSIRRVNTFVDMDTELVEGSEKRTREELMQESAKKQKV